MIGFGCRYTPAIEAINEKLKAYSQLNTRVDFVDCGAIFLEDDDKVAAHINGQVITRHLETQLQASYFMATILHKQKSKKLGDIYTC